MPERPNPEEIQQPPVVQTAASAMHERVRTAVELLESIADDRAILAQVPREERTRLLRAAGLVSRPDAVDRWRLLKETKRQRKAAKVQRAESTLAQTGIRKLRRQTVFTTPNVFPPTDFQPNDVDRDPEIREAIEPQNCYICKRDFTELHHFYDQLCPPCAALNFAKRGELADLTGRVGLLTGGRVK